MKAITICQPYATLIVRGAKRVENRTWPTKYRGNLYIHAGKSREWLDVEDGVDLESKIPVRDMPFGAVVAIAKLADCINYDDLFRTVGDKWDKKYPWLRTHEHTNGPWCWILESVTPIGPWPYRGALGLFEIDDDELGIIANEELGIPQP